MNGVSVPALHKKPCRIEDVYAINLSPPSTKALGDVTTMLCFRISHAQWNARFWDKYVCSFLPDSALSLMMTDDLVTSIEPRGVHKEDSEMDDDDDDDEMRKRKER
ncbi:hypothetical protein Tco_1008096 [Tanacetum coccineum]